MWKVFTRIPKEGKRLTPGREILLKFPKERKFHGTSLESLGNQGNLGNCKRATKKVTDLCNGTFFPFLRWASLRVGRHRRTPILRINKTNGFNDLKFRLIIGIHGSWREANGIARKGLISIPLADWAKTTRLGFANGISQRQITITSSAYAIPPPGGTFSPPFSTSASRGGFILPVARNPHLASFGAFGGATPEVSSRAPLFSRQHFPPRPFLPVGQFSSSPRSFGAPFLQATFSAYPPGV